MVAKAVAWTCTVAAAATVNEVACGKEWIAVVAPELKEAIAPLVERRTAEGWHVTVFAPKGNAWSEVSQEVAKQAKSSRTEGATSTDSEVCLLLVGDADPGARDCAVAAGQGTLLRMKGRPTDRPWALLCGDADRPLATGRLPARSREEAREMVGKILAWPAQAAALGPFPEARLVVGFHHAPKPFEPTANQLVHKLVKQATTALPPQWLMHGLVHIDGSPWQVIIEDVRPAVLEAMQARSTMLIYMGHSGREGATSKWTPILTVPDWRAFMVEDDPHTGLFFSCGCNACEVTGPESYGMVAMRAPSGPAAVIGSQGESFAAMGYLAAQGLVDALAHEPTPERLGEVWHGAQHGLAKGTLDATDFAMLDAADGSQAQIPLAEQRLEHLESWMLLGDPAMPLVTPHPRIALKVNGPPAAGAELVVTGTLPADWRGAGQATPGEPPPVRVTFERERSTIPKDLPAITSVGTERRPSAEERRRRSDDVVLSETKAEAKGLEFQATVRVPADWKPSVWVVRAAAGTASGVLVRKPDK